MKQKFWFVLVAAALILTACGKSGAATALPTVVLEDNQSAVSQGTPDANAAPNVALSSGVIASGALVSDQHVELAFLANGNVKELNVSVGQQVTHDEILAQLDNSLLQSQLDQATLALNELTSPLAISSAQKAVAEDQSVLNTAQGVYNWWLAVNSDLDAANKAKADLVIAQDAQKKAQEDFDKLSGDPYSDKDKAVAYQHLYDAQQKVKEAQSKLNLYRSADPYQLAIYKASVDMAKAKLAEDQVLLAALTNDKLPDNPIGQGYANLLASRLNVLQAQTNLNNTKLISPINGTVSAINFNPGDFVSAGQIQMVILDPALLHVETTDLSERDIPGVKVGQSVSVTIKAIGETVTGKVKAISPQADTLGGDVVYRVFITLDSLPASALPGMSVTVNFQN